MDSGGSKEARIGWGAHWHNLANAIEPSMPMSATRPFRQITLTTCYFSFGSVLQIKVAISASFSAHLIASYRMTQEVPGLAMCLSVREAGINTSISWRRLRVAALS